MAIFVVLFFVTCHLVWKKTDINASDKGRSKLRDAIKSEYLDLMVTKNAKLEQLHTIERRMAELEDEYHKLSPGGPFRSVSLKEEFGGDRILQLYVETAEGGRRRC
ncbi:MAG: hypothetical protein WC641_06680 [Patescibacteria group bacterium]